MTIRKLVKLYLIGVVLALVAITILNRTYLYKTSLGPCPPMLAVGSYAAAATVILATSAEVISNIDINAPKAVQDTYDYINATDKE